MTESLSIAIVLDRYDPNCGGLEAWTDGFARWLLQRGHKVTVLCFGEEGGCPGVALRILDGRRGPLARAAKIAEELAGLSFDIVHDMGTGSEADVFQPHTGSRLVNAELEDAALAPWLRIRRKLSPGVRRGRREIGLLERRQFADPSRIIAVSRMVRDQIAARYGLDADRITVIHNGVDTARFSPERLTHFRSQARARWFFGEATVFLLVANNFLLKGLGTALEALARLEAMPGDIRVAVAGAGNIEGFSRLARRLGVDDHVRFLGHVDRIEEAYAAADVSLQPTHYDACSLSTLEGLASGLPTITTRANGAAELMISGEHGIVLDGSTDAEALAAAMRRMLDPDLRRLMGGAARRLGAAHDVAGNYLAVEDFYRLSLARTRTAQGPRRAIQGE